VGALKEEQEFLSDDDEEFPDDAEVEVDAEEASDVEPEEPEEVVAGDESLDDILTKRPEERPAPEEAEEESILSLEREERVETLSVRVVPQQPTEFTCRKCYLVKLRSQLADKKRMYCRDCA
jgi:hypothetical protein